MFNLQTKSKNLNYLNIFSTMITILQYLSFASLLFCKMKRTSLEQKDLRLNLFENVFDYIINCC